MTTLEDDPRQWVEELIDRINNDPLSFTLDELESLVPAISELQRRMTPFSPLVAAARYSVIDMAYLIKASGEDGWTPELEAEAQAAFRADGTQPSNRIDAHKRVMEGLIEARRPSAVVDEWKTYE